MGLFFGLGAFVVTTGAFVAIVTASDRDFRLQDTGDTFDKVASVAKWSDRRLKAATEGAPLPDPPSVYADVVSIKIGFATTLVYEALLVGAVAVTTQQLGARRLLRTFGMGRYSFDDLWRPAVAVVAAYVAVAGYAAAMKALGISALEPQSTVPEAVTRDTLALALAGVLACLAAPLSEELFFRGLVFTGLLRWGFFPAAAVSAGLFTLAHLDVGSLIPFFFVGMTMAWLYWSKGNLWDSVAFHVMFNTTSYLLLLARV